MAVVKDKKDVSVLLETQLPEFITQEYPKFKKFIEKYYEFMESHQLYFGTSFTFNEDKIVDESDGTSYIIREDADIDGSVCGIQLESDRDTAANANLMFSLGETLTGNISGGTAIVSGTKGNTIAFIKSSSENGFVYGEKLTGSVTGSYGVLANGIVDGTFPTGSIESFRSKAPSAAIRELSESQDIDTTEDGLIDDAWKKEFYTNIPQTTVTDRRQLLKRMKQVYRSKGNEASFTWLFQSLFNKEDIEFYYPKSDLLKLSDGRWALDKSIKILTSGANNISLFTGRRITGQYTGCSAMVESQQTSFAGALQITELRLSDVVQGVIDGVLFYFNPNEVIISETDIDGLYAEAVTSGILQTVQVDVGGTNYVVGDEIHVNGGGGQGARARVAVILDSVIEGITIIDSGDGYVVGDTVEFINDGTGGSGATAQVNTIIPTGVVLKNTDLINPQISVQIAAADYAGTLFGHNANTPLFGNSSLTFSAGIKSVSAKLYDNQGNYDATLHILPGDRIAKQVSVDTSGVTLTQSVKTVTLSSGLTEEEKLDVVGGKLTYANANTNIVTGFSSNTVLTVRDTHTIGAGQTFEVEYASNTYWGTVISANTTAFLYSVGSYYRDSDIGALTVQNFVNDDNIIVYNNKFTKLGAAAAGSGVDAHLMHNGVTFQVGNTPASVTTDTFTIVDAHGALADVIAVCTGALNITSINVGAIDTFLVTSGGGEYVTTPPVSVSQTYTPILGNALDVIGAPNTLLNVNLHSFTAGTIAQDGNVVTLTSEESFPDANSGVLTLTYANGATDTVTAVTNSTVITVATEKVFGVGVGDFPDKQTYSLSYMAMANNITKNTLLYSDDYSARARVLDFIDKKSNLPGDNPYIAYGNTVLRVDMTTAQDFGGILEFILLEEKNFHNDSYSTERLVLEDIIAGQGPHSGVGSVDGGGGGILTEDCVEFIITEDASGNDLLVEEVDGTRFYTEQTTGTRVTAHTNVVSTYTTGTMAQSGLVVTGVGTVFPNDFVRGTITYHDSTTSTITGYTNATSFTVEDSKTVGAGNTYSISYNSALTWGTNREITVLAGGTGNRTVTVTEVGHYLRSGDKVKISGSGTTLFNGVYPITVANTSTYTYTLPENTAVTSPAGELRAMPVASVWLATSNAVYMDTSPKGNNAVIEVSSIAIGAIQTAEVYDFGAGYSSIPILSTTSGDQNAELTAGIGAYATYPGYYTSTTGLLSDVPKIQDNKYYQNFSYVLKTDFDVNDYRNSVKRIVHPSGMIMFGELAIRSKISVEMFDQGRSGNVDSLGTIREQVGIDHTGRKYHNITLLSNTIVANTQLQSYGSNNEMEIYTANHPWQAMDARLETYDDVQLQLENYVEISSIARTNSTMYVVTETLHGLETGDTVEFSGDESTQLFNSNYTVTSAPTTNTYTIIPTTDYGTDVSQSMYDGYLYIQLEDQTTGNNIIMEDADDLMMEPSNYLKSKVISFANNFRADSTNWDSPFSGGVLNEDSTEILLERGGTYLYPTIQFPEAESGVISIDVSFNSDILLEDDNGAYGYGYLLDETSAGSGDGPQRFISLEEDTQGPNHQYESIPIVDTHVIETWYNSTRNHLISEDDLSTFMMEDESLMALDTIPFTHDNFFTKQITHTVHYNAITTEDGSYIINEGSSGSTNTYFTVEDRYGLNQNDELDVILNLVESVGWHLRGEDDSHIRHEDGTRVLSEEDIVKAPLVEVETEHYDSLGWNIKCEDSLSTLSRVDLTVTASGGAYYIGGSIRAVQVMDGARLYRFLLNDSSLTGHPLRFSKTSNGTHSTALSRVDHTVTVISGTNLAGLPGNIYVIDGVARPTLSLDGSRLYRFDVSGSSMASHPFKFSVTSNGTHGGGSDYTTGVTVSGNSGDPSAYVEILTPNTGLTLHYYCEAHSNMGSRLGTPRARFVAEEYTTGVTVNGTPGSPGAYIEIFTENITQSLYYYCGDHSGMGSSISITSRLYSYGGTNLIYEDTTRALLEEGPVKSDVGQIEVNLYETIGWHLMTEDNVLHLGNEDGTRLLTEQQEPENNFCSDKEIILKESTGSHVSLEDPPSLVTKTVTVVSTGSGNKYSIDGVTQAKLLLQGGTTYRFDVSDSSFNEHPFRFSLTSDGVHASGIEYVEGVTVVGLEGNVGSYVELQSIHVTQTIYYYCMNHSGMGGTIHLTEHRGMIIFEDSTSGESLSRMVIEDDRLKSSTRNVTLDLLGEVLAFEDGSGYFIHEGITPNRTLVTPQVPGVRGAESNYMYPTRLNGAISIVAGSTTVVGSTASAFTTDLAVGDVFQTGDENVILEDSEDTIIFETLEIITHEDVTVAEVQNHVLNGIEGQIINTFKWYIGHEDSALSAHAFTPNVVGSYVINLNDEQYNMLDESSDFGKYIALEDSTAGAPGQIRTETSEFTAGISLLLETGDKMILNEGGDFKVATITDDDTLTVTRQHYEGTGSVPFWKRTTDYESTAVVSYK